MKTYLVKIEADVGVHATNEVEAKRIVENEVFYNLDCEGCKILYVEEIEE